MVVPGGVRQRGVEVVGLVGVVPQRSDGVRGCHHCRGPIDWPTVPVDRGLGGEPRRVGQQVEPQRDQAEDVGGRAGVPTQHSHPRARHPVGPARGDVHRQSHHPEEGDVVQPGPLRRARQSQQHARAEAPPANAESWTPGVSAMRPPTVRCPGAGGRRRGRPSARRRRPRRTAS